MPLYTKLTGAQDSLSNLPGPLVSKVSFKMPTSEYLAATVAFHPSINISLSIQKTKNDPYEIKQQIVQTKLKYEKEPWTYNVVSAFII